MTLELSLSISLLVNSECYYKLSIIVRRFSSSSVANFQKFKGFIYQPDFVKYQKKWKIFWKILPFNILNGSSAIQIILNQLDSIVYIQFL